MSTMIDRAEALALLQRFGRRWAEGEWGAAREFLAESLALRSNHKGNIQGVHEVVDVFQADARTGAEAGCALNVETTNHYVTADGSGRAMVSAYVYGEFTAGIRREPVTLFGAVMRLTLQQEEGAWKIGEVLLSIVWAEGQGGLLNGWKLPPGKEGWRPGDAPPALVSELDSPWVAMPDNRIEASEEERIEETYSRYAWGVDQNDMALFRTSYTEHARGLFPPLGPLNGLHDIVGSLKEFRRHWPWMQHFGQPLKISLNDDGETAEMWVGRRIPGQWVNERQAPVFGAHYRIELVKEDGGWKFTWSEYVPGWFGEDEMPFDR